MHQGYNMQQQGYDANGKPIMIQAVPVNQPPVYDGHYVAQQQGQPAYGMPYAPPPMGQNPPPYTMGQNAPPYTIQVNEPGNPAARGGLRIPYTVPVDDVYPWLGFGFITLSLYLKYPQLCGCSCLNTTLCCSNQQYSCIATDPEYNPLESACICNRTNCECCHPVKTFTKFQFKMYCIDGRFALPGSLIPACPDPEYPTVINFLGLTCLYCDQDSNGCAPVMACGKSIGEIKLIAHNKSR